MEGQYVRDKFLTGRSYGLDRSRSADISLELNDMFRKLYMAFGMGVLLLYAAASWFGWELANSGSKSRLGVPFIFSGPRGGK